MSGTLARGITRRVAMATQTALGTRASAGGGTILRRITAEANPQIDTFGSQEILQSQQVRDLRNGGGRGQIAYNSHLAPGAQNLFFEGLLRRPFSTGPSVVLTNVTAAAGPPGTFTRAAGSWITDGFRAGMVVRHTGWATTGAANNARNYRIIGLTATVMTVLGTGDEVVAAKAAGDSVTIAAPGRVTWIPATGQVIPYFTYEDLFPDMTPVRCDIYEDARMQAMSINVPASGLVNMSAQMLAREFVLAQAAHFSSPGAASTIPALSGVTGLLRVNGADTALITSLGLQIGQQVGGDPVVAANRLPDLFVGPLSVQGSGAAYLRDYGMFDLFRNETEAELILLMDADSTLNGHFICITLPRIRIVNPNKSDGPLQIMQRFNFVALENTVSGGAFEATTIMVQDSAL